MHDMMSTSHGFILAFLHLLEGMSQEIISQFLIELVISASILCFVIDTYFKYVNTYLVLTVSLLWTV